MFRKTSFGRWISQRRPNILLRLALFTLAFWMGCATKPSASGKAAVKAEPKIVIVLDNLAFMNEGRELALRSDGSFSEVHYSDSTVPQLVGRGNYRLQGNQLSLVDSRGESETFNRVRFDIFDYWIHAEDGDKIADQFFRLRALKSVPIEVAQFFVWWRLHNTPDRFEPEH